MIPTELEPLLEPLERFESVRRRVARKGGHLCDLAYANPYEGVLATAEAAIQNALDSDRLLALQYSPFGGATIVRRAVADALRGSHGLDFGFRDVVLTPGAMGALQLALRAAARPGGEVIIPVPCWLDYPLYVRFLDLVPVYVPLSPGSFEIDVPAILDASSERTCAVLLSHPGNPTGRNYGREGLDALGEGIRGIEERFGSEVTLIADETHRDFVAPGEYLTAAAYVDRTLLVYSFGKYHFMQGQRLGYAAVSPRHPRRHEVSEELVQWTRITGMATPTAIMQRAAIELLALRHDLSWLTRWRQRYTEELAAAGYRVSRPDATLFIYVETPAGSADFDFVEALARAGVLALPAPLFHHSGYFRISLTGSAHMLEEALPILGEMATA